MNESRPHSHGLDDGSDYDMTPLNSVFHDPLAEQTVDIFLEMRFDFKMCKHLIRNVQTIFSSAVFYLELVAGVKCAITNSLT